LEKGSFMQTLAFLWFEIQGAQQYVRETFVESHVMPFFTTETKEFGLDLVNKCSAPVSAPLTANTN
jgi:hypothetical protein